MARKFVRSLTFGDKIPSKSIKLKKILVLNQTKQHQMLIGCWDWWRELLNLEMWTLWKSFIHHNLDLILNLQLCLEPLGKRWYRKAWKFQHRATKLSHALKNLDYQSRCNELNLTTLKKRRTRGDLIQKF